jgi:hypothetical protein
MEMKDYQLTCGEVIDNLLMLADAYEKASAGKAPNGFAFNPTDAAANMKAAVHFIGSFGQQVQQWIPVEERLPPLMTEVLGWHKDDCVRAWFRHSGQPKDAPYWELWSPQDRECDDCDVDEPSHWMPLPEPPEVK